MGGEFGRDPNDVQENNNTRDGRDHWARGFSWGFFSINQPLFNTTAVGYTGPMGERTDRTGTPMDHPVQPSALGGMLYRAMGYDVGINNDITVPTPIGPRPPVDVNIVNTPAPVQSSDPVGSAWLLQQFGLA
jgi:hypothetical protein